MCQNRTPWFADRKIPEMLPTQYREPVFESTDLIGFVSALGRFFPLS
jgi:hypothetical protein